MLLFVLTFLMVLSPVIHKLYIGRVVTVTFRTMNNNAARICAALCVALLLSACQAQEYEEIQITQTNNRPNLPPSVYVIDELAAQADEDAVDITGTWSGKTQITSKYAKDYTLVIKNVDGQFIPSEFSSSKGWVKLDIRKFTYDHPIISFEADSGMYMYGEVPIPFVAVFVVNGNDMKGHFRAVKSIRGDEVISYDNYDADFSREASND